MAATYADPNAVQGARSGLRYIAGIPRGTSMPPAATPMRKGLGHWCSVNT